MHGRFELMCEFELYSYRSIGSTTPSEEDLRAQTLNQGGARAEVMPEKELQHFSKRV